MIMTGLRFFQICFDQVTIGSHHALTYFNAAYDFNKATISHTELHGAWSVN